MSDFSKQLLESVWCQPLFDLTCVGKTLYSRVKELDRFRVSWTVPTYLDAALTCSHEPPVASGAAGTAAEHQEAAESLQVVSQGDDGVRAASRSPDGAATPLLYRRPVEGEERPAGGAGQGGAARHHRSCREL